MGLTIDNEPDLFAFAKNNIIIAGKVNDNDVIITQKTKALFKYGITNAQGGMPQNTWIEFLFPNYNFTTLSKTIRFTIKDNPTGLLEIKSFAAYGKPLKEWTNYFLSSIFKIPYFVDNYIFSIDTSFAGQCAFEIAAKSKGAEYNFSVTIPSPYYQPGNATAELSTGLDILDNAYVSCSLYKKNNLLGIAQNIFIDEKILTYKAFLNSRNEFSFSINTDILKYLESYLHKIGDTNHIGTNCFKYIIELKNRNNTLNNTGATSNATDILYQGEFIAINGGRAFYESIAKDINFDYFLDENRLFLTRRPKIYYVGDTVFINDFIINNDDVTSNNLFATVQFNYENGTSEIMDIPNLVRFNNKFATINFNFNDTFWQNIFNEKFPVSIKYQVKNLDRKTTMPIDELSGIFSETREIVFNRKPFRTENYFRFQGSLSSSEFAWLNGKIETEVEANGSEFEQDLSQIKTIYGNEEIIWKAFQFGKDEVKYTQKFKINTGFKTKEEIQWLTELIGSELIFWYTKEQMTALVNSTNGQDYDDADLMYQVVIIDKNSIKYYDSDEELQAMSFEFKIATESATPHFTIKDNLKPLEIDKDTFAIDVTQAQTFREDFNPTVFLKLKNGYNIGDTITFSIPQQATFVIKIVEENEPNIYNNNDSIDIVFTGSLEQMALQIREAITRTYLGQLEPIAVGSNVEFSYRNIDLNYIVNLNLYSNFVEKQYKNCNNIWKYILNKSAVVKIDGFIFENGTNKIYLHEILSQNQNGTDTFYNFKMPNNLEDWIYCIADYFNTNPQLSLFKTDVDDRGLIKIKYKAGGGLANSNALMIGLMDKYIFVSKLQD